MARRASAKDLARRAAARLRAFRGDERGVAAILAGAFGLAAVASLAIGIDLASVYLDRRTAQGAVDLAAIAAAQNLDRPESAARATLAANKVVPQTLSVTLGNYTPDAALPPEKRFRPNVAPINAAKVDLGADARLFFGRGLVKASALRVRASAVAASTQYASFSIGSRLASLNGGVANALLSSLVGGSVSLSVMDYNALATAKVDLLTFLDALAIRTGATAGSYDKVLAANATISQVAGALADVGGGGVTTKATLTRLANAKISAVVKLNQLASLGPLGSLAVGSGAASALATSVSLLDLLSTSAQIANGTNVVDLDLGAQVPGLLGLTASLVMGERPQSSPWLSIGQKDVTVSTAQTRLRLIAQVGGGLLGVGVRLPIAVDIASGKARLSTVSCGANPATDATVTLGVTPSAADLWVGEPTSLSNWNALKPPAIGEATLVNVLLLLSVTGSAHVAATNLSETAVPFDAKAIAAQTVKTVKTTDVAKSTLSSLITSLDPTVKLLGIGLSPFGSESSVKTLLKGLLAPVAGLVDPVLNTVLDLLGVSVGEADVQVRGVRCDGSTLVG
ncbi:putative membrane protein [Methylopila capsulata]|uniref:Membrane protein n=1 Tax=Methylopila capsulata TaxID=61654 RepID=A0A9W6MSG1_9HYPH|nr:TadG family pilus assembly protein [Methylopila capsulata]MBM7852578.1 putative membrane protein [Methylopila capsulata]GLK56785.1 hypothetical protein GCM10008170_28040 [Methylopila capsulata]